MQINNRAQNKKSFHSQTSFQQISSMLIDLYYSEIIFSNTISLILLHEMVNIAEENEIDLKLVHCIFPLRILLISL